VFAWVWLACGSEREREDPWRPDTDTTDHTGGTTSAPTVVPPHVVLVLVDDLGWTGPSSGRTNMGLGSDFYETPNFDALAEVSVSFDGAYASPVCQAGRAVFLTGQSSVRTKVYTNGNSNERVDAALRAYDVPFYWDTLQADALTIAEMLGPAGWETGWFGKWHLGEDGEAGPSEQGFDLNVGGTAEGAVTGGSDGHFAKGDGSWDLPALPANGIPGQFMADRLTDEVIAWFEQDPGLPRLAVLSHFSLHHPVMAPESDVAAFLDKPPGTYHSDPVYAGMEANFDANLGRLIAFLEATPDPRLPGSVLMDHTLLVVSSDNGGAGGLEQEGVYTDREFTNNLPLFSGKSTTWEGGVRVPMVARWDAGAQGGRIVSDRVSLLDIVPTVLAVTGVPEPVGLELDGASLMPFLEDASPVWTRAFPPLYYPAYMDSGQPPPYLELRENPTAVLWRDSYKLVYDWGKAPSGSDAGWHLYDLAADLGEADDLAVERSDLVSEYGAELLAWLAEHADPLLDKETGEPIEWPGLLP
jgi:arylsulfatase A-like enzyme